MKGACGFKAGMAKAAIAAMAALALSMPSRSLGASASAEDGSVSTNLEVFLPSTLASTLGLSSGSGGLYHRDAMFGNPYKGTPDILGEVEYVTAGNTDGCSEDYVVDGPPPEAEKRARRIFMVDRGECTFTQKVRIAQSKGASGVIVVNNRCMVHSPYAEKWQAHLATKGELCAAGLEEELPFMAYDNSGHDVTIPAFLVTLYDGQLVKDCLNEAKGTATDTAKVKLDSSVKKDMCAVGSKVIIKMVLDVPTLNEANLDLWLSADDLPDDMHTMAAVASAFGHQIASFTPRYMAYDSKTFGCASKSEECERLCVFGTTRAFCAVVSPQMSRAAHGVEVVEENIRQQCMWKVHEAAKAPQVWWNYVREFQALRCAHDAGDGVSMAACGDQALAKTGDVRTSELAACIASERDSLAITAVSNKMMHEEEIFTKAVVINGVRRDFGLTPTYIAQMLCESFDMAKKPRVCSCVPVNSDEKALRECVDARCFEDPGASFFCSETASCVESSQDCVKHASGVEDVDPGSASSVGVFFIVISVAAVMGGAGFVYHKRSKRQMQEEVRDILSEYMPLEELNSFSAPMRGGANGGGSNGGFNRAPLDANDTVGVI